MDGRFGTRPRGGRAGVAARRKARPKQSLRVALFTGGIATDALVSTCHRAHIPVASSARPRGRWCAHVCTRRASQMNASTASQVLYERQRALDARCGEVARKTKKALTPSTRSGSSSSSSSSGQRTVVQGKRTKAVLHRSRRARRSHRRLSHGPSITRLPSTGRLKMPSTSRRRRPSS